MKNNPIESVLDVSVIMPTYNCLAYLPQAVESVLSQSVSLELLIVDDSSTDGSHIWLADLANKDPRVKILKGEHKGVSAARNLAIAKAAGAWVAFLDADDYWYPEKLSKQLEIVQAYPKCVLNFTEYDHFDEQGGDLGRCFQFWPRFSKLVQGKTKAFVLNGQTKASIYEENVIGTSTVLVDTKLLQVIGGFDETLFSASDWDLWLKISAYGDFTVLSDSTTGYLVRSNSISRNQHKRLNSMKLILERYRKPMESAAPHCFAPAFARYKLAQAEAFQSEKGGYVQALMAYLQACYQLPTKRNMKACLSHVLHGIK
ncbi:glycosyltransferase family 2 protein [Marinomonas transparens]|uniref:Glycosyltransferase n=1 Tax=Marinomonas transparens TaxID=2795388 RepID=A0A934JTY8_9GAMM|nr:glycosyltransferase family 2 protein [Marinomonas transparens]MBJ7538247.1 glycosyltransferase [Marinomonas transparens]